jgi:hypothetical protein
MTSHRAPGAAAGRVAGILLIFGAALAGCGPAEPPADPGPPWLFPVRVGGAVGFIDRRGTLVVEPQYELAGPAGEGLIPVRREGLWGFIDMTVAPDATVPLFAFV